ncbi:NACHT domain-containing protein [Ralstonia sp. TCR112]|uniref:NACHT domain-containing protein n=1 Tax=Ralstonia TaxID=48736 RepID=UPI0011BE76A1|nr:MULTISPECIES: NACHT domain-containing protein [unclassified Ralstonia]TXD54784.1 NACHT domain-containing protein [Ralstonia sp. TCR112]
MSYDEDLVFENEVRRIARARWPSAQFDGAAMKDGRERDGIFETDDVIHYVEATTSRRAEKAKDDTRKMFGAMTEQQRSGSMKGAIGWFVTKEEPTADQREAVKLSGKQQVKAVSFSQFQQALVDVPSYFELRENHMFGSVLDPVTKAIRPSVNYIPLDLLDLGNGEQLSVDSISVGLAAGGSYTILGDYGAGKSMTLRQIYFALRDRYRSGGTPQFPLYINLREHSGQDDPSELLERHARRIGYEKPHSLVAAWRAGFAILIIDGFDEITTLGISSAKSKLKEARRRSLEAIRKLIEQTPHSTGFVIAGRDHYFNSPEERRSALGTRVSTRSIAVGEFTRKQIQQYLEKVSGKNIPFPAWLPTRPLLVAYIATRGLLDDAGILTDSIDSTDGWHYLLDQIFEREAKISPNLDGRTLRKILERLSSIARASTDGLGPLTQQQIRNTYIQICESEPDEQANLLLQRLPGLGVYRDEDDSRTFVDLELAEVCRARDVTDFIVNPYGCLQDEGWKSAINLASSFVGKTAITRISRDLKRISGFSLSSVDSAFIAMDGASDIGCLKGDVAAVCLEYPYPPKTQVIIEGEIFENYVMDNWGEGVDFSSFVFRNCLFECVELLDADHDDCLPKFENCVFMMIRGRLSKEDLPADKFDGSCTFEGFSDSSKTQAAILNSSLTRGEKLVLTILRKLFVQSLSGRAESALYRGLDLNDRQLIPDAIRLLQQQGLVMLYNRGDGNVWIPVRKEINRVRRVLATPNACDDIVMAGAKNLVK